MVQLAYGAGRAIPGAVSERTTQARHRSVGAGIVSYPPCPFAHSAYNTAWTGAGQGNVVFHETGPYGWVNVSTNINRCSVVQQPCYFLASAGAGYDNQIAYATGSWTPGSFAFDLAWCE